MKRLFISQPFTGKTEEEIFEIRKKVEKFVVDFIGEEVEVIDQYHQDAPPKSRQIILFRQFNQIDGNFRYCLLYK